MQIIKLSSRATSSGCKMKNTSSGRVISCHQQHSLNSWPLASRSPASSPPDNTYGFSSRGSSSYYDAGDDDNNRARRLYIAASNCRVDGLVFDYQFRISGFLGEDSCSVATPRTVIVRLPFLLLLLTIAISLTQY